jgi:hypothetical protein
MSSFCKTCGAEISDDDSGFDAFWQLYPKKADKVVAFKSWKKLRPADRLAVMNDLPRRIPTWALTKGLEGEIVNGHWKPSPPNPSTYLNKRRWEDEISVPAVVKPKMDGGLARRSVDEVLGSGSAESKGSRLLKQSPVGSPSNGLRQEGQEHAAPDLTMSQRRANMARLGSILDGLGKIF